MEELSIENTTIQGVTLKGNFSKIPRDQYNDANEIPEAQVVEPISIECQKQWGTAFVSLELWLVKKTAAIFASNQIQNLSQS